jgi:hypothetical protein
MSGTHPAYSADWTNGNVLADLTTIQLNEANANSGYISGYSWYTPNGDTDPDTLAITAVKVIVTSSVSQSVLPDTGQTTSYTSTFGEDSDYLINAPSYTNNGNGTVTDNNTLLVWQREDDNTLRTWNDASTYCSNLTLGGYSDWRLPMAKELQSIVHYDEFGPSINATYFPGTEYYYWSSTVYAGNTDDAWDVDFGYGNVGSYDKSDSDYVRCVRSDSGTEVWLLDFSDNEDGTVTHYHTSLVWQQVDDNVTRTWENAISYCESLSLAGQTDWRLPNIRELQTLLDYSHWSPAIDSSLFPGTNSSIYWSSTTHAEVTEGVWGIDFNDGYLSAYYKTGSYYVRCVRTEQIESGSTALDSPNNSGVRVLLTVLPQGGQHR